MTDEHLNERVVNLELKNPDFPTVWSSLTCHCCKPDWIAWGITKLDEWAEYCSLRWVRGDNEPEEENDEVQDEDG